MPPATPPLTISHLFGKFAGKAAVKAGSPVAFVLAVAFIIGWAVSGSLFHYSDEWKMVISVVPAVITFLLVFLIQHSQNKETLAVQLKLNELIRATEGAHTLMVNLEKLTEVELRLLGDRYEMLAQEARKRLRKGGTDEAIIDIPVLEEENIPIMEELG